MKEKPIKGLYYYYGNERLRVRCIKSGERLSWFIDEEGHKYQFYNEDVYETK